MYKNKKNYLIENKELIVTSIVILLCLIFSLFFPTNGPIQNLTAGIFFLVILPILYIKIVLKNNLQKFGLNLENKKEGVFWSILMFFLFILIFYILYKYTSFKNGYTLSVFAVSNFWIFLLYEMVFSNFQLIIQTFFFQGFIFFSYVKKFSYWAILLQFLIFGIILYFSSAGFSWQAVPPLAISLFSGIIVYKSQSIIYSYGFALLSTIILDSFIIYHLK